MLTWNVTYHCKPGKREAFFKAISELGVRGNSNREEGNLKYDYFFDAQDPDALLLVESWTEPALQQAHCQTSGAEGGVLRKCNHRQIRGLKVYRFCSSPAISLPLMSVSGENFPLTVSPGYNI